jgi:hypothetical protein
MMNPDKAMNTVQQRVEEQNLHRADLAFDDALAPADLRAAEWAA